jgi:hypothetical protein
MEITTRAAWPEKAYPIPRLKAPQFIEGDDRRVPLWGGEGRKTRTNALDKERTMLYTDSMDETSSLSDRHRRGP